MGLTKETAINSLVCWLALTSKVFKLKSLEGLAY